MLRKEHIGARRCRSSRSSRGVLTFKLWLFYYLKAMRHTVTWIGRTLLRMELNGKLNKVRVGECLLIRDARITGAWADSSLIGLAGLARSVHHKPHKGTQLPFPSRF